MATIVSAQILGIREAHNTMGSTIFNSTDYSILLFFNDGSREIVEGSAKEIQPYLRYIPVPDAPVPVDALLEKHEERIRGIVSDEIYKVFEALHPVPRILDLNESDAVAMLKEKGFAVELVNEYPQGIPQGFVHSYERPVQTPMTILLDIRHNMPDVRDLPEEEALCLLRKEGFTPRVSYSYSPRYSDCHVLDCVRDGEISMSAALTVTHSSPDLTGLNRKEVEEVLRKIGMGFRFTSELNDDIPYNTIIRYEYTGKLANCIISSGPHILRAEKVFGKWDTLPDSDKDEYSFNAWYDRDWKTMTLQFALISACKKPHALAGSAVLNGISVTAVPVKGSPEIRPDDLFVFSIEHSVLNLSELPDRLEVAIDTTHGLLKSRSTVTLHIDIVWPELR